MGNDCVKLLVSDALTRNYIVVKNMQFLNMQLAAAFKCFTCSLRDPPALFSSAFSVSQDHNSSLS